MSTQPNDLAPLIALSRSSELVFRQAKVESWDPTTGANVVVMGETRMTDVPALNSTEGFSIAAGDVVGMLGWKTAWFILGRIAVSNDPARKDIQVVIYSSEGITVKGGGGVTVDDGGTMRANYPDGSPAAYFGSLVDAGGTPIGHGLLAIADDASVILSAYQRTDGTSSVYIGDSPSPVSDTWTRTVGQQVLDSGTGTYFFLNISTTTEPANVYIGSGGALQQVTSSAQHKLDIDDLVVDPDTVLQLRPRTWRDRAQVEADPDTTRRVPGFVAEEIHALGLAEFVTYDETGSPMSIAYDRLVAALIPLLQRQQAELDAMQVRLARLEGQP